jgi:hypothetical protein
MNFSFKSMPFRTFKSGSSVGNELESGTKLSMLDSRFEKRSSDSDDMPDLDENYQTSHRVAIQGVKAKIGI